MATVITTQTGSQKISDAAATSALVTIAHVAIGTANGVPYQPALDAAALVNEVARVAPIRAYRNAARDWVIVAEFEPATTPDVDVLEIGLFDTAGDLIAVVGLEAGEVGHAGTQVFQTVVTLGFGASDAPVTVAVTDDEAIAQIAVARAEIEAWASGRFLRNDENDQMDGVLVLGSGGNEGGELRLEKGGTSTLTGDLVIDERQGELRFWDQGDPRGVIVDVAAIPSGQWATSWHSANDGAGSGLDADKLDGRHAGEFVLATAYTAADVLSKIKTVDGAGSGLDADSVDGVAGSNLMQLEGLVWAKNVYGAALELGDEVNGGHIFPSTLGGALNEPITQGLGGGGTYTTVSSLAGHFYRCRGRCPVGDVMIFERRGTAPVPPFVRLD